MAGERTVQINFKGDASGFNKSTKEAEGGLHKVGEAADASEQKAQGFSDTLTGTADVAEGFGNIMKGNVFEGFVQVGGGLADLAGGFADFLIPALSKGVAGLKATTLWTNVTSGATKIWAGIQWLMNTALFASPITWIIGGILALIVVIGLIVQHTGFFVKIWRNSWAWIKEAASNAWNWIKKIPGWIGSAFAKIGNSIASPFKAGLNAIAKAWNNTVGKLSFTIPSWVPGLGGKGFSMPNLPTFATGGRITGPSIVGERGAELFIPDQPGTIIPHNKLGDSSGGDTYEITLNISDSIKQVFTIHDRELKRRLKAA